MKSINRLLNKMRRQWVLEQCTRSGILTIAGGVNAGLGCWLVGFSGWSLVVVAGGTVGVLVGLGIRAWMKSPSAMELAKIADDRAGAEDLFASAMEFDRQPDRFGWFGSETVKRAIAAADGVTLRARWTLGSRRDWCVVGAVAAGLVGAALLVNWLPKRGVGQVAVAQSADRVMSVSVEPEVVAPKVDEPMVKPVPIVMSEPETRVGDVHPIANAEIPPGKINEVLPEVGPIDLGNATAIPWEPDEVAGRNQPKNETENGRINPVEMSPELVRDFTNSRRNLDEGGPKDGDLDILVIGPAEGRQGENGGGGKDNQSKELDGITRDPKGDATRMAVRPNLTAVAVRSVEKLPARNPNEVRPMSPLDMAEGMARAKSLPVEVASAVDVGRPGDYVVRQEGIRGKASGVAESYFELLRKADR
ncbi:MAG: hypothetical protein FWD53_07530 [Phycisphaerales bacterium]|nr:hypothetical protein [Phycisphaerales bacterium]